MKLRLAVCDDEPAAVRSVSAQLKRELAELGDEAELCLFTQSPDLARQLRRGERFDALFADIDMPELDGIRLGKLYRAELKGCLLVFISNREDLVFDAFQARPFRFIPKSQLKTMLPQVLRDILVELQGDRKLSFPTGGSGTVLLRPERIAFVEAVRKHQLIHDGQGVHEVSSAFQAIADQLAPYDFVRCHKSYLVNCRFIRAIAKTELTLDDGTVIPVGRTYLSQVQDAFGHFAMMEARE